MVGRQNRMNGAPGELAVADLAPTRPAHPPGLADREWREVVMQEKGLLVRPLQCIDPLLILAGAERCDHQCLRLAAGEERRTVRTGQHSNLAGDRAHRFDVAAVDALARIEDVPAHDLGFDRFENIGNLLRGIGRVLHALRAEMRHHLGHGGIDCLVALRLIGNGIGRAQIRLDQREHVFFQCRGVKDLQLARFFRRLFRKLDDGVDHRLEMTVAEHHGAEHDLFGQFLRFGFDHQHRVLGTGDDEIELALRHLVEQRVEHVFIVDEADARGAERTHEGCARERQRRRGRDHRQNVGIVLEIVRQRGHDHLRFVAPAIGEQRAHRAIDQARDKRLLLGRAAFALEIAAGDSASGVEFLLIIDGERQKIDALPPFLGGDHRRQHFGLAVGSHHGAVGLARDLAGL